MRNFLGRRLAPKQTINLSSPQEKDILGLFRKRERVVCFEDGIRFHPTPTEEESRHYPADQVRGSQENLSTDLNWDM